MFSASISPTSMASPEQQIDISSLTYRKIELLKLYSPIHQ